MQPGHLEASDLWLSAKRTSVQRCMGELLHPSHVTLAAPQSGQAATSSAQSGHAETSSAYPGQAATSSAVAAALKDSVWPGHGQSPPSQPTPGPKQARSYPAGSASHEQEEAFLVGRAGMQAAGDPAVRGPSRQMQASGLLDMCSIRQMSTSAERGMQGSSRGTLNRSKSVGSSSSDGGGGGGNVDGGHISKTHSGRRQKGLNVTQPPPHIHPSQKAAVKQSTSHTDQGAASAAMSKRQSALKRQPQTGRSPSSTTPTTAPSHEAKPPDTLAQLSATFTAATNLTEILSSLQTLQTSYLQLCSSPAVSPRNLTTPSDAVLSESTASEGVGGAAAPGSQQLLSTQPGPDDLFQPRREVGANVEHLPSLPGGASDSSEHTGVLAHSVDTQQRVVGALACAAVRVGQLVMAGSFHRTTVQLVGAGGILDDIVVLLKRVPLLQQLVPHQQRHELPTSTLTSLAQPDTSTDSSSSSSSNSSGSGSASAGGSGTGYGSGNGGNGIVGGTAGIGVGGCMPQSGDASTHHTAPAPLSWQQVNHSLPHVSSSLVRILSACAAVGELYSAPLTHHVLLLLGSCPATIIHPTILQPPSEPASTDTGHVCSTGKPPHVQAQECGPRWFPYTEPVPLTGREVL